MKNQIEQAKNYIELFEGACENQEGLRSWKEYETYLAQGNTELAENSRKNAISWWESAAEQNHADSMINLAIANIDNIALALLLMSQVFSKGKNVTGENNLLGFTFEKPGFKENEIHVKSFVGELLNRDKDFFSWRLLRSAQVENLKGYLARALEYVEPAKNLEEVIKISLDALRKYTSDPRVSTWFFRLLSDKAKMVSFSKSERLVFLLEALDHFNKFIAMPNISFETIQSYGKVLFNDIDNLLGPLTTIPHKKVEINWKNTMDAEKMALAYREFIAGAKEKIPLLELFGKAKMVSFTKSKRLGFLLEALDHFNKFFAMPNISFETIQSYGKVLFKEIDRLLEPLTTTTHKKVEINWNNTIDAEKMALAYKEFIAGEKEKILALKKKPSPQLLRLKDHYFLPPPKEGILKLQNISQKPKKTPDIEKKHTPGF